MVGWICMRMSGPDRSKTRPHVPSPEGFNDEVFRYLVTETGSAMLEGVKYDKERHLRKADPMHSSY